MNAIRTLPNAYRATALHAGFWYRAAASLIDTIILIVAMLLPIYFLRFRLHSLSVQERQDRGHPWPTNRQRVAGQTPVVSVQSGCGFVPDARVALFQSRQPAQRANSAMSMMCTTKKP
ncbi:MAG: hypothetical protein WBV39_10540 [Rudaea sp.]